MSNQSIDLEDIRALIKNPREKKDVEIKSWLDLNDGKDKACLAKAMIALTNHGGGYVIIGFRENDNEFEIIEPEDDEIVKKYNQDIICGIIEKYADPNFQVDCFYEEIQVNKNGDKEDRFVKVPIIKVPGGHRVPVRTIKDGPYQKHIKKDSYYIRRAGPASEEPKKGKEWAELIRRCVLADKDHLIEQLRGLLSYEQNPSMLLSEGELKDEANEKTANWFKESQERFEDKIEEDFNSITDSPFKKGYWKAGYVFIPEIKGIKTPALKKGLTNCKGSETGWPIGLLFKGENTHPYDGKVETWLAARKNADPGHADFWRASPKGKFIVYRGYQEDIKNLGDIFDFILPIWRIGELILHATRFADEFIKTEENNNIDKYSVIIKSVWNGLENRQLDTFSKKYVWPGEKVCHQDNVESKVEIDNLANVTAKLPDLVYKLVSPLHNAFDFFDVRKETIVNELNRMRGINDDSK